MQDIFSKITGQLPFEGQFAIAEMEKLSAGVLNLLGNDEKRELEEFSSAKRKREFVTSRLLLKKLAAGMGINPDDFSIRKNALGQPFGNENEKRFFVSIAHTRELVFCGITKQKSIGIDLEPKGRIVSEKLKGRILHESEKRMFSEIETIRLWTIKEAYIKLRGQGLRLNMNQVPVRREGEHFYVELNNDKRAKICSFQSEDNWLAIAYYQ